jgi:hypothetical protein
MNPTTKYYVDLELLLKGDPERSRILRLVQSLGLPDCWIAAGFVRNAVWDFLHGRSTRKPSGDIDVIWFDSKRIGRDVDLQLEGRLMDLDSSVKWSVKNQARMHSGNGDAPYLSANDAMRYWPETATAVGVRYNHADDLEISAPLGLEDLFGAIVRPTERFLGEKHRQFEERLHSKQWCTEWPLLRVERQ